MKRKYFGTDGVRGQANDVLTPELAVRVGHRPRVLFSARTRSTSGWSSVRTRGFRAT